MHLAGAFVQGGMGMNSCWQLVLGRPMCSQAKGGDLSLSGELLALPSLKILFSLRVNSPELQYSSPTLFKRPQPNTNAKFNKRHDHA